MIYIDSLTKSGNLDKAEEVLGKLEGLLAEDTSFELNNYGYNQGKFQHFNPNEVLLYFILSNE